MKKELLRHYTNLIYFLEDCLGQDYEISLYDLTDNKTQLIALSNNCFSNKTIGDCLPDEILSLLIENTTSDKPNFINHLPGEINKLSLSRNSYLLIRDEDDSIIGVLCVTFDDSRYTKMHDYILSLAHPLFFLKEHSYHTIHNLDMYERADSKTEKADDTSNNVDNLMKSYYRSALRESNLPSERLTQEERMIMVKKLQDLGFFKLKGAVQYAAKRLGCSSASIYRYLSEIKNQ